MSMDMMAAGLQQNLDFLNMELADFSDADMMVRPCPGANHPMWQVGHLVVSEAGMLGQTSGGAVKAPPESFAAKFTKETSKIDDPNFFPKKAEVLDQFKAVRASTVAWVKTLKEADLAKDAPEMMRRMCPNVGSLLGLLPVHVGMHVGQIQVARRKLGKPILF
jgi:hypothetical protein